MKDPYKAEEALSMILVTLFGVSVIGLLVATVGAIASAFNL
jgi:hypothetical protein|tara:strand:- start:169 stop:291 length:123 start_codon:yes stop_codon:yes gene_type:complete